MSEIVWKRSRTPVQAAKYRREMYGSAREEFRRIKMEIKFSPKRTTPIVRFNAAVRIASRFNARLVVNVFRGMNRRWRAPPAWDARKFFCAPFPISLSFFRALFSSRRRTRETNLAAATMAAARGKKKSSRDESSGVRASERRRVNRRI